MTAVRAIAAHPILRRVLSALGTLFGVAVFVFVMLRAIPGNQITAGLGTEAAALTPAQRAALEAYYGLDKPLVVQFFSWLGNIFTGNLGISSRAQVSVVDLTAQSLPVTLELAVFSIILALLIGIPLGMLSAFKPDSPRDAFGQTVGLLGLSIPAFLLATALLAILSATHKFNPNGEAFAHLTENPLLNLQQMLLGIQQKEYAVVQSTVLLIALAFVLIAAAPSLASRREPLVSRTVEHDRPPLVEVVGLVKEFPVRAAKSGQPRTFTAVDQVSFAIRPGTTVSIVGESGSGKSTTASLLLGLEQPTAGQIMFDGVRCDRAEGPRAVRLPAPGAAGLPEPVLLARPALHGGPEHRRAAAGAQDRGRRQPPSPGG